MELLILCCLRSTNEQSIESLSARIVTLISALEKQIRDCSQFGQSSYPDSYPGNQQVSA